MRSKSKQARETTDVGSAEAARSIGLRYVDDHGPGIRRRRAGQAFRYLTPRGRALRDDKTLARIRSLAIPPAWEQVWICPLPEGHLQATGRDARGRKQYRYHPRWRGVRDENKFARMIDFARTLPRIRRRVRHDLALRGMPRDKVLAAVVRLLEKTLIRVGNDEYAKQNASFGLTTIRNRHVRVRGTSLHFDFRGKSGIERQVQIDDPRLARIVRKCQDLPGQDLFVYVGDDGEVHDVGSGDVNDYLRAISGRDFTAKDFRTWAGTSLAVRALRGLVDFDSKTAAKRNVNRAVEAVAKQLGNTKAVCRKSYIHPAVIEAYQERAFVDAPGRNANGRLRAASRLSVEEAAVLALLEGRSRGELNGKRARR